MKAIVCIDLEQNIGYKNEVLFNFKEDKKFFKEMTTNHIVVMGGNTYRSIGKPLPNRTNYVLSNSIDEMEYPNKVFHDFDSLLKECLKNSDDVFIIGGAQLYNLFKDYIDEYYVTMIETTAENADAKMTYRVGKYNIKHIEDGISEKYHKKYYITHLILNDNN